jgi:hypothetical protein
MRYKLLPLLILLLLSCENEESLRQKRIAKEVDFRLVEFEKIKRNQCIQRLLVRAEKSADSIMLKEAFFDAPDSLIVPNKQRRPETPEVDFPKFEKPVAPLIDSISLDSIRKDSIRDTLQ